MTRRDALGRIAAAAALTAARPAHSAPPRRPNVIFLLADDLGSGDLGCFGQKYIATPNLDRMAAEGLRFTQAYCGTSVCAPSRSTLITGQHTGHTPIRANREIDPEGQQPMPADTYTIGHLMQSAGYRTACIGKWGLGYPGSDSTPDKMGFDRFFGYNCQRKAHSYFPTELWRDTTRVPLDGKTYSEDLIADEALTFIRDNRERPFFLFQAFTLPHGDFEIPSLGAYADRDWSPIRKTYAAMASRLDADCGRILALLKELRLDDNTLVFFASDNGGVEVGPPAARPDFKSNGDLRGIKRSMYEGGIRSPSLARWPAQIAAGTTSAEPWAFWDMMPTLSELTGQALPARVKTDGISILPALRGGKLAGRDYLYWELHEGRFIQALRQGDWKVVRPGPLLPLELYHLAEDPAEQHDLAPTQRGRLRELALVMKGARTESALWPVRAELRWPQ